MFDYTLTILAQEIHKLEYLIANTSPSYQLNNKLEELKFVVEILNQGSGYLTEQTPVKVRFFNELEENNIIKSTINGRCERCRNLKLGLVC